MCNVTQDSARCARILTRNLFVSRAKVYEVHEVPRKELW